MERLTLLIATCVAAMAALTTSCDNPARYRHISGSTWGTVYNIKYRGAGDLSDSAVAVMRQIDLSLSPFEPRSVISAINAGSDVAADAMLRDVFVLSQRVCSISGGAFDPTVAPLVNLWGFGYRDGATDRPTQRMIDSALTAVGIRQCALLPDGRIVRRSPATEFNFSAIAKGYGVDRIADMLERNGVSDYMVEVGGELRLGGHGPSGDGWVIQIDAPVVEDSGVTHQGLLSVRTTGVGIATSGNYRNHRQTSEGSVGHTISPTTGYPVQTGTLSATVIASTCVVADALATAIMAMPIDRAVAMIEAQPGVEALIVTAAGDGYEIVRTTGFNKYINTTK